MSTSPADHFKSLYWFAFVFDQHLFASCNAIVSSVWYRWLQNSKDLKFSNPPILKLEWKQRHTYIQPGFGIDAYKWEQSITAKLKLSVFCVFDVSSTLINEPPVHLDISWWICSLFREMLMRNGRDYIILVYYWRLYHQDRCNKGHIFGLDGTE